MYEIYDKDICAFRIDIDNGNVQILDDRHIPFGAFPEEGNDPDTRFNNLMDFRSWCLSRTIPTDRAYAGKSSRVLVFRSIHPGRTAWDLP
jgi:hypothetical protein